MQVKAIKDTTESLYSCTHIVKSNTGIGTMQIRLFGADAGVPAVINIPADADRVFVTENGKTIGNYPPKDKGDNGQGAPAHV